MATIVHWGKYYPPDRGGIESVTASIAAGAAAIGHRVLVVCFATNGIGTAQMADGVQVFRARQSALIASQPLSWHYFSAALRQGRQADLVHLHAPNMLAALAALFLGRRPRLLVHWHSDVIGKGLLGHLLRPLERRLLERADCVVCTSQPYAMASDALRPFQHKVTILPNGVADIAARAPSTASLPPDLASRLGTRPLVLSVGRLVPYKGFDVLIEAAQMLPSDVVVVIVGTGPMQSELSSRIERIGLQAKVILVGHLEESVLDALYRKATLFCMPSLERSEAFGVAIVEAMAYGLPVVTTRILGSGVPWVNLDQVSGLNVAVGNARQLAEACASIVGSPELRARFAAGARQRYMELFTETVSTASMMKEYDRILRS